MSSLNNTNGTAVQDQKYGKIPLLLNLALRGHLCSWCSNPHKDLKKCAGCKRVAYCGSECQRLDWKALHRKDCKNFKIMNDFEIAQVEPPRNKVQWRQLQFAKHEIMKQKGGFSRTARQAIIAQAHCTTCYQTALQIQPPRILQPCGLCQLIFTCNSCPPNHSDKECSLWQCIGDVEVFRTQYFAATGQITPQGSNNTPRTTYRPLSSVTNWRDFYIEISDKAEVLGPYLDQSFNIESSIIAGVSADLRASMKKTALFFFVSTDTMTMPLTILSALEDSVKDLATRKSLTLHIVGADAREAQQSVLFEELLHLLPALQSLKILLVGPESYFADGEESKEEEMECCPSCKSSRRKRTLQTYAGLYHTYATTSAKYQKPDMAVLFHSGRSQDEEEAWLPTTAWLVDSGTLTLCTTFNKREAIEEVEELDQLGVKFIKRPEVNTWRGLVPYPEFMSQEEEDRYYYMNGHRYIFKGKERRNIGGLVSEGVD